MNIPALGFGTYNLFSNLKIGVEKFLFALDSGYKLIDTAEHYNNHTIIGKILAKQKINQKDIYIVTKLWRNSLDYKSVLYKTQQFLNDLQVNYLDCVLIHWPNNIYNIVETLGALEQLKNKGIIRSYGVSNFSISNLQDALAKKQNIEFNQVEFHPLLNLKKLYNFCVQNNITLMSHSSLAGGKCLENTKIKELAYANGLSSAQVVYAYLVNKNIIPITGLGTNEQIIDNLQSLNIKLKKEEMKILDSLNINYRSLDKSYSEFGSD